MKIAIIGGNGGLGGHAATFLAAKGHEVTVCSRTRPLASTPMAAIPYIGGDYVKGDFTPASLKGFDAIVFAAAADPRHVPAGHDMYDYFMRANAEAIPAFARAAREAGVQRFLQIGSFYHQAQPELALQDRYVRSRQLADEGARAEARPDFDALTINPPVMVGAVPGAPSMIMEPYVAWAQGKLLLPLTAPPGGTNFMSFRSLSEAIEGALHRGQSGKAYLVGDENLSYAEYFRRFFKAAGQSVTFEIRNEEHAIMIDGAIVQGRGNTIAYVPDPDEASLLGYRKNDISCAIESVVAQYSGAS